MTVKETCKQVGSDLAYLKKTTRKTMANYNQLTVRQTLQENLPLFSREAAFARKQCRESIKFPLPENGARIHTICEDAVLNADRGICRALWDRLAAEPDGMTTYELGLIVPLTTANLLHLAVLGVQTENPGMVDSSIEGLYALKDWDSDEAFTAFSTVEQILVQDPAGAYSRMDAATKSHYRSECARQAQKAHITEREYALHLLQKAKNGSTQRERHIGTPLLENPAQNSKRKLRGILFIATRIVFPWIIARVIAYAIGMRWISFFLYLPLHEVFRPLLEWIFTFHLTPYFMPRMEMNQIIPDTHRTLITVSALLPMPEETEELGRHLHRIYQANHNGAVGICLLADLPESHGKTDSSDECRIQAAEKMIDALNRECGGGFVLLARPRTYIKTQRAYAGWERKRGAILQLVHWLQNKEPLPPVVRGDTSLLENVKYILALDQDTELYLQSAYDMVTAAAHPLNQPVIDYEKGVVTAGYGVLVPMICHDPTGDRTPFVKLFAGPGGVSAYHSFCANHYQDLFSTATFAGKGLLDVAAYDACLSNALPTERILSHDMPEGAFLRCGFLSDVEVADGDPDRQIAWNKRLHRWVRGDFQNVIWLSPFLKRPEGWVKNPLRKFDRLLMNDNLIRELLSPASLLLLGFGWLFPKIRLLCLLLSFFAVTLRGWLALFVGWFKNGVYALLAQYDTPCFPSALRHWLRNLLAFCALPTDAAIALSAAGKGLYRQWISRRNLLEWSTAHQLSKINTNGPLAHLWHNLPSLLAGGLFMVFGPGIYRVIGGFFFLSPMIFYRLDRPLPESRQSIGDKDRKKLIEDAAKYWQYYADHCTEKTHFLPPDNRQEQPVEAIAMRTSPTNIGFYLLSAVAAENLGLITTKEMVGRIALTLKTVDKLACFRGHLLNWYNIETLEPLYPRYCSTVDSGNFICCLVTVRHRLQSIKHPDAEEVVKTIDNWMKKADFRVFYNKHRHLMHIGYDLENQRFSGSYYDMLMSECRLTGYYAVAMGQLPRIHWGSLSRTLTRSGRKAGPVSWTGTAFEYWMSQLLLPTYPGTLLNEAVAFCLYGQRQEGRERKLPWGATESGYYAFDGQFNYQYKPHGTRLLAVKRYAADEYVAAPYASYLALPFAPKTALENLKRFEALGAIGKYGLYEAVDFTPERCPAGKPEPIKSFMAHHVGMSLCAIDNALNQNYLCRLFMQKEMEAGQVLLMERIPVGTRMIRVSKEKAPEKPPIPKAEDHPRRTAFVNSGRVQLFSSNDYRLLICENGATRAFYRGQILYTTPSADDEKTPGFIAAFGENLLTPVTAIPGGAGEHRVQFAADHTLYTARREEITCEMRVGLSADRPVERRNFTLRNHAGQAKTVRLLLYTEPFLHTPEQMNSHPAFYKLFLESKSLPDGGCAFVKRPRGEERPLALAMGVTGAETVHREENAFLALSCHGARFIFSFPQKDHTGGLPAPCACFGITLTLPPKSKKQVDFYIAAADTPEDAVNSLQAAKSDFSYARAPLSGTTPESIFAGAMLPFICKTAKESKPRSIPFDRNHIWQAGVSGELPLITAQIERLSDLSKLQPFLGGWRFLTHYGIASDFCILYREGGEYTKTVTNSILRELRNGGYEPALNQKGGIHLIDLVRVPAEVRAALLAASVYRVGQTRLQDKIIPDPLPILPCEKAARPLQRIFASGEGCFTREGYAVSGNPRVPYTHLLSTPRFGCLLTHRSLGFTYAENARENRLTPWSNDPLAGLTGERLLLRWANEPVYYDMIDGSLAVFSHEKAEYRGKIRGLHYTVTVWVTLFCKHICVEWDKTPPSDISLHFLTLPCLDHDRRHKELLKASFVHGIPVVHQPFNNVYGGTMALYADRPYSVCWDPAAFRSGQSDNDQPPAAHTCCCLTVPASDVTFLLAYGKTREEAVRRVRFPADPVVPRLAFSLSSPDEPLNQMMNTYLPHQIIHARLWSRTGFYQCSGAYGFRDQLQDAMALAELRPDLLRAQILRCCSVQFTEGDVLHWWHPFPKGPAGVRTKCSDDPVWLSAAIADYYRTTGDMKLLLKKVPYLQAEPLAEDETQRFLDHPPTGDEDTVYAHGRQALRHCRFSPRGLALIGSCDWNDGFSRIGIRGKGESVWLTQFIAMTAQKFAELATELGDTEFAESLRLLTRQCHQAVETHCWDTDHYIRAFSDDGTPLGGNDGNGFALDVLPQAFSVLCKLPNHSRNRMAVETAQKRLVDREHQLIHLLDPPVTDRNLGYIAAYPPGIRENGGQYTHGVLWLIQAMFQLGEVDEAWRLLQMLNPAHRCRDRAVSAAYQLEPYAMAGDIYTHPDAMGRGGWSQYTGAAGWYFQIVLHELLGLQISHHLLTVAPRLPRCLLPCRVEAVFQNTPVAITFTGEPGKRAVIPLDGKPKQITVSGQSGLENGG